MGPGVRPRPQESGPAPQESGPTPQALPHRSQAPPLWDQECCWTTLAFTCTLVCATHGVEHLQDLVLLAGVQPVDDHRQPGLVLAEAVDGLRHLRHQLHFLFQHLWEDSRFPVSDTGPGQLETRFQARLETRFQQVLLAFMKPSLFSLCSLLAALWSLFL